MLSPPAIQSQLNQRHKLVREVSGLAKLCLFGVPIYVLRIPVSGFSHQFAVNLKSLRTIFSYYYNNYFHSATNFRMALEIKRKDERSFPLLLVSWRAMTNTRSQVKTWQPTEGETRRLLRLRNRNRVVLHRQFRRWVETKNAKSLTPEELEDIRLQMKGQKQSAYDQAKEATAGSRIHISSLDSSWS